jgi:hypothetical protein
MDYVNAVVFEVPTICAANPETSGFLEHAIMGLNREVIVGILACADDPHMELIAAECTAQGLCRHWATGNASNDGGNILNV